VASEGEITSSSSARDWCHPSPREIQQALPLPTPPIRHAGESGFRAIGSARSATRRRRNADADLAFGFFLGLRRLFRFQARMLEPDKPKSGIASAEPLSAIAVPSSQHEVEIGTEQVTAGAASSLARRAALPGGPKAELCQLSASAGHRHIEFAGASRPIPGRFSSRRPAFEDESASSIEPRRRSRRSPGRRLVCQGEIGPMLLLPSRRSGQLRLLETPCRHRGFR